MDGEIWWEGKGLKESRVSRFSWRNWISVLNGLKGEKDLSEAQMKLFVFLLQFNESFIIYITVQRDRYFFFFYFETLYNHKIVRLSVRRVIK